MTDYKNKLSGRLELIATILLVVVTVGVGGLAIRNYLYPPAPPASSRRAPPQVPSEPVSLDGAIIRGERAAKVAIIVFSEFECPFCGVSARDVLPEIDRQYLQTGKALLAFRHYPLNIHPNARKAAEASECAEKQGKFWDFHDWAFNNQRGLDVLKVSAGAESLGLDMTAFSACLGGGETAEKVASDVALGDKLGAAGTPAWYIGTVQSDGKVKVSDRLQGAVPLDQMRTTLDKLLASAGSVDF
jgi:protein-disulfide isomerase